MQHHKVTLFVPGMLWLSKAQYIVLGNASNKVNALCHLLSKSQTTAIAQNNYEAALIRLFGLPVTQTVPVAALHYASIYPLSPNKQYMCADPVHLKPDSDHLTLVTNNGLALTEKESRQLISEINSTLSDQSWRLFAITPNHWVMELDEEPRITTVALRNVVGKNIGENLPQGERAKRWRKLGNEIQMLLHASEVNAARESKRQLPVNSLWFWGEGNLNNTLLSNNKRVTMVYSEEMTCTSLARYLDINYSSIPQVPMQWIQQSSVGGSTLIVLDQFIAESTLMRHADEWLKALEDFSENWCEALLVGLKNKTLDQVSLICGNEQQYDLSAQDLRKFWRRVHPLGYFLKE